MKHFTVHLNEHITYLKKVIELTTLKDIYTIIYQPQTTTPTVQNLSLCIVLL